MERLVPPVLGTQPLSSGFQQAEPRLNTAPGL